MKKSDKIQIIRNNIRRGEEFYQKDVSRKLLKSEMESMAEKEKVRIVKEAVGKEAIGEKEAKIIREITGVSLKYQTSLNLMGWKYDK